jgi:hypothetical protein
LGNHKTAEVDHAIALIHRQNHTHENNL